MPPDAAVLALTSDPALADELHRVAAAAGVTIEVRPALADGTAAPLLLLGADAVEAGPHRRRAGVVVVTLDDRPAVWRAAVAAGAEAVLVLPADATRLAERLADATETGGTARVVGVLGGCGGAGASVLAAALATVAADGGQRVLLADLDPLGGGVDVLLGVDDVPGMRWPDLAGARGRLPATSVHDLLPRLGSLAVLSWAREPADVPVVAADAVLRSAVRGHDLVVLDLGRRDDPLTDLGHRLADELLVVVPARVRAVVAAQQLLARQPVRGARVVVRRGPGASLPATAVCDALGLGLAAVLRDEPRLDLDGGEAPGLRRGDLQLAAERCLASTDRAGRAA